MNERNREIKEYAKGKGVCLWELAERMGIADNTLSHHLRKEFAPDELAAAKRYVDEIAAGRG